MERARVPRSIPSIGQIYDLNAPVIRRLRMARVLEARFAVAQSLQFVGIDPVISCEIGHDRLGALFRQRLVILIGALGVGMAVDEAIRLPHLMVVRSVTVVIFGWPGSPPE